MLPRGVSHRPGTVSGRDRSTFPPLAPPMAFRFAARGCVCARVPTRPSLSGPCVPADEPPAGADGNPDPRGGSGRRDPNGGGAQCEACGRSVDPLRAVVAFPGLYHTACLFELERMDEEEESD